MFLISTVLVSLSLGSDAVALRLFATEEESLMRRMEPVMRRICTEELTKNGMMKQGSDPCSGENVGPVYTAIEACDFFAGLGRRRTDCNTNAAANAATVAGLAAEVAAQAELERKKKEAEDKKRMAAGYHATQLCEIYTVQFYGKTICNILVVAQVSEKAAELQLAENCPEDFKFSDAQATIEAELGISSAPVDWQKAAQTAVSKTLASAFASSILEQAAEEAKRQG